MLDSEGSVWLTLHSGSRNIGKELADHHIGVAQKLPHNQGLVDRDLAVFVADTPQMAAYRNDLFWAQEYAKYNRAIMMALLKDVVRKELKRGSRLSNRRSLVTTTMWRRSGTRVWISS